MAKKKKSEKDVEQYAHPDKKRLNNPPVGLVTEATEPLSDAKKKYAYDPHLDPQLQWAGKAEHTSFEVPTVSLHVHERIDPKTVIENVRREETAPSQLSLFDIEKKPLREAVEFYKHPEGWSNRLIAGDSLLVMNSLLEKEGLGGKVQMIYFDPPYGIKYGSNFQPFVNKREVKDGKDADLTAEPEMIRAFRDTWELGIHSYLSYLRDRLLLARELLHERGSVFVQISDENVHLLRCVLDEVFNKSNEVATIVWKKGTPNAKIIRNSFNYILWYAKDINQPKFHKLYSLRTGTEGSSEDPRKLALWGEFSDDENRTLTTDEKRNILSTREKAKVFRIDKVIERGDDPERKFAFEFGGKPHTPKPGFVWRGKDYQMERLKKLDRLVKTREGFGYKFYIDDYPIIEITNLWEDTAGKVPEMRYAVQTHSKIIRRCLLMATDPGDLALDITCGSGTTAYVAEQWGRRWITCDTSRVALTLAKQRLMTASFDYYQLAHPGEGVGSGFIYKTVPHITLKSIANNEPPKEEILYDQPLTDRKKVRVTGPFTVEAVPSLHAKSLEEIEQENQGSGESVTRSGETLRQSEWRDELLKTGVRAKGGKRIKFTCMEPMGGTRWIQCEAETKEDRPQKVFIVFGPEHAPLEQRMVENAWQEAKPFSPDILLFCAFQFDDEAAKDIDELKPEIAGMQLLKAQMNADLFTDDLKKRRSGNDSFWLIGQPDVEVRQIRKGDDKGRYQAEVMGFDYYNPKTGNVESGGKKNIAMWLLDTNYDERSLFPSQVFFSHVRH